MKPDPVRALFAPGDITCSQAALEAMRTVGTTGLALVYRHITGDWPDDEDRAANQAVLDSGADLSLISHYPFPSDIEIVLTTSFPLTPSLRWTDICLDHELDDEDRPDTLELDDVIVDLAMETIEEEGVPTPEITKGVLT
jgi:hypothetical protein